MATAYRIAAGNWSLATAWSTTSGGANDRGIPTSTDDVICDANTSAIGYTLTMTSGAVCRSFTTTAPATGDMTLAGSGTWSVYGSWNTYAGMVFTCLSTITWAATTTGHTITTNGVVASTGINTFNGVGGEWTLQDAWTSGGNFILTRGNLIINGQTVTTTQTFQITGTTTRGLDISTAGAIINCGVWNASAITNLTFDAGTSTINVTNGTNTFNGGGLTYYDVNFVNTQRVVFNGANTFNAVLFTMAATKTTTIEISADQIAVDWTVTGAAANERPLVMSTSKGTARTLTVSGTFTGSNVDFQDITKAGAASGDLSAITGGSGNCGRNTGITFTTAADQYWFSDTGNWDDASEWFLGSGGTGGAGRVPLPQDLAILDSNSFTTGTRVVTQNMPRIGGVNWTGATNTPAWAMTTTCSWYGSITLISGMTMTGTSTYTYEGDTSSTFTCAGHTIERSITTNVSGTLTLQDHFAMGTSRTLTLFGAGTFACGTQTGSIGRLACNAGATMTGSGAWELTGNASVIMDTGSPNFLHTGVFSATYSGSAGTRTLNCSTSASVTSISITAGTDTVAVTGTNRFWDFIFTSGFTGTYAGSGGLTVAGDLELSSGLTRTYTGIYTFTGTVPSTITSNGQTHASAFTINGIGGTWLFADAFTTTGAGTLTNGAINAASATITCASLSSTNSNTREIAGDWVLTGTGTVWNCATSTNLTVDAATTIKITDISGSLKTFAGGSMLYANLWSLGGTGNVDITGSNTFTDFQIDAPYSLRITAGTTQTFTNPPVLEGTAGNIGILTSITGATHDLTFSGADLLSYDYMDISYSHASRAAYAGVNSTDNGNNDNWFFTAPPSGNSSSFFIFF